MSRDEHDPIDRRPDLVADERVEDDSSPSSERETEQLQRDQDSAAFDDPSIDRDRVHVLPGTGDYTDEGDVDVDPGEVHIPRHPDRDGVGPLQAEGRPGAGDDEE